MAIIVVFGIAGIVLVPETKDVSLRESIY